MRSLLSILFLLLVGCNSNNPNHPKHIQKDTVEQNLVNEENNSDSFDYQTIPFLSIASFPNILDTLSFINQLKSNCHVSEFYFNHSQKGLNETINVFKKIKLNGTNKTFYLVEYDWHGDSPNTEYPWRKQFLFDSSGMLIKIFQALHVDVIDIFPGQDPFLVVVVSTARGNGGHEIYKVTKDTLENIYEGYYDYDIQTYDAGEDQWVYEPYELRLVIKDFDNDGYNDISFEGKLVLTQGVTKNGTWYDFKISGKDTINYSINHPFKKLPLKYVFLYNPKLGHFQKSHKYSIENPYE